MTTVVVDNTNIAQMLAEAENGVMPEDPRVQNMTQDKEPKVDAKPTEVAKPAEEAKPADDADDIEGEDGLTPKQKREFTESMLKTLGKKHAKQRSAEEFAALQFNEKQMAINRATQLEQEVARLKAANKPPEQIVVEQPEPKREDFKTDLEYLDARADWRGEQKFKQKEAEAAQLREQERLNEIRAHAVALVERAIELQPDFKEVTEAAEVTVPPTVAAYMQESDLFAELGYYFANPAGAGPKDLERIRKLPPAKQLVEIGKIESKLSPFAAKTAEVDSGNGSDKPSQDAGTEAAKSTNGAKPSPETDASPSKPRAAVIKPLSSGSAAQVEKPEAQMSGKEALAAWQKKHGTNLTRRQRH